jgi:hypothetical protein
MLGNLNYIDGLNNIHIGYNSKIRRDNRNIINNLYENCISQVNKV